MFIVILQTEVLRFRIEQPHAPHALKLKCYTLYYGCMGMATGFILVVWWDYNYEWHPSLWNWVYGGMAFSIAYLTIHYGQKWLLTITKPNE